MVLRLLLLLVAGISALADPSIRDYPNAIPALKDSPQFRVFDAKDGTQLSYSVIDGELAGAPQGPLVFVQGKSESAYRYVEFAREMQAKGWGPIYILDSRGQGFSEKVVNDALHVESFKEYVKDFIQFMDGPVKKDLARRGITQKPFIVAHSMGAAISNLALRERPDLTDRIVYIAPMFGIHVHDILDRLHNAPVKFLANTFRKIGLSKFTIGGNIYSVPPVLISSDLARMNTSYKIERDMGVRTPKATAAWVSEAFRAGDEIMQPGTGAPTPSLIFQGTYDKVVSNSAIVDYACATPNCTLVEFAGAHALHQEREPVRRLLEEQIDDFFRGKPILDMSCQNFYKVIKRAE